MSARRVCGLMLTLCALASLPARATHPEEDPDQCRGDIGGAYIRHGAEPRVQVPKIAESLVVPITDAATGPFYLEVRDVASEYMIDGVYLWVESNGQARLQRGGRSLVPDTPGIPGYHPCNDSWTPDTLIY